MPVIDERHALAELLRHCPACYEEFCENITLISDDGELTDDLVLPVFEFMKQLHHVHVH